MTFKSNNCIDCSLTILNPSKIIDIYYKKGYNKIWIIASGVITFA